MKILIALKCCHKYVAPSGLGWEWTNQEKFKNGSVDKQIEACRETWVRDFAAYPNVDVRFFYGRGATRLPLSDEVFLDVADDYKSLSYKTKAICEWMTENQYDFGFLTDDDTFIWVDNLLSSEFEKYDYMGSVNAAKPHNPYVTGLGYWLSSRAARFVANSRPNNELEDHWVGEVLQRARITPKHDRRYVSIGKNFVGVETMPRNPEFAAIHPCNPEMIYAYAREK